MKILAIESSCDETACAIVEDGRRVLSNVIYSQIDLHATFGGVLPEAAARQHLETVNATISESLDAAGLTLEDVDCIAATLGPGLVGSLLVGATAAKSLCLLTGKPFRGVNHLYAHVASNYLETDLEPPFLCLLVSGGHTQLIHVTGYDRMEIVGETLDDAVGEAYDKVARLLELGFPGGPALDKAAQAGNPKAFVLPHPVLENPFDFSFSGIKTAVLWKYEKAELEISLGAANTLVADMAASFQKTAVDILFKTTVRCAQHLGVSTIAIAGGVSANSALRKRFQDFGQENADMRVLFPSMAFCTDNAAMVAASAFFNPISQCLEDEVFSRQFKPSEQKALP